MTMEALIALIPALISALAIVISLTVQVIKTILDSLEPYKTGKKRYNSNVLAFGVAIVLGVIGTVVFFVLMGWEVTGICILIALLIGFLEGIITMTGYDKVKPVIKTWIQLFQSAKGESK